MLLLEHDSAIEAYQKGEMVKAEIDGILAAEFCQVLLTPVYAMYKNSDSKTFWIYLERISKSKQGCARIGQRVKVIYGGVCDLTWEFA